MVSLFSALFSSSILMSCLLAWLLCQAAKVLMLAVRKRTFRPYWLVKTGSMPSTHSAVLTSLTIAILLEDGVSSLFVASLIISIALIRHLVGNDNHVHSFSEVVVGIAIGVFSAMFVTQIL